MDEVHFYQIISEYFIDFMLISHVNVVPSVCVSVTKNTGHTVYKSHTAVLVFEHLLHTGMLV
jgi:hypothetical protein